MDADDSGRAFPKDAIKRLKEAELYELHKRPKVIYLSGDPSGMGRSGYGLCGSFFDRGRYVVRHPASISLSFFEHLSSLLHTHTHTHTESIQSKECTLKCLGIFSSFGF
jgi:hypothetical protein